jgi:hypothetical protein
LLAALTPILSKKRKKEKPMTTWWLYGVWNVGYKLQISHQNAEEFVNEVSMQDKA